LYLKNKIEKIKKWEKEDKKFKDGTRKHEILSKLYHIKENNDRYLVVYQIESRKKEKD
jgi:hypothetical protein